MDKPCCHSPGTSRWSRPFLFFVFLLVCCLSWGTARGADPGYTVYTEELEPVHFSKEGKIVGIATEIVQAIFKEAGYRITLESYPWKRSYSYCLHNDNSFIFTINRTPEREQLFQWIGPILPKRTWLYRLKSRDDIEVTDIGDLKKYTTTVILGYALTRSLEEAGLRPDKELIVKTNKKEQIRVFLKGHADLITGNEFTLPRALEGTGFTIHDMVPVLLMNEKGYYLAANPQVPAEIVDRLRKANDKVQASGLVQKVIDRYTR